LRLKKKAAKSKPSISVVDKFLKDKKSLVMGFGLLGGGLATTKWLVKHGAKITVTDLKNKKQLEPTIKELGHFAKKIKFVLGKHQKKDFIKNDLIIVNPAVPKESSFLVLAKKHQKDIQNEASLFFRFCKNPIIAITGTRGKTTTTTWTHHFLKAQHPKAVLTGNSSDNPMLNALDKLDGKSPVSVELSSWHLEMLPAGKKGPSVAIITNIYPDHLNRYRNIKEYAQAKANIFLTQTPTRPLVLNADNEWTKFFLKLAPKNKKVYLFSLKRLPKNTKGLFYYRNFIYFQNESGSQKVANAKKFLEEKGEHNLSNLLSAILGAHLAGIPLNLLAKKFSSLPQVPFRQEIIHKNKKLIVINDTTATTPEACIAAVNRFAKQSLNFILISGGTDKKLNFSGWARVIKKSVRPANLFLLNGSATQKIVKELKKVRYFKNNLSLYPNLKTAVKAALEKTLLSKQKSVILFSPAGTSFELFKNEFDRGRQFNQFIKSSLRRR